MSASSISDAWAMHSVLFYFSIALGGFGANLIMPTLMALRYAEAGGGAVYLLEAILILFVAGALFFSFLGHQQRLRRADGFLLVVVVWIALIVLAALPIMVVAEVGFFDGLFESTSGLTTTGASVFGSVSALPRSLIFWRAQMQWLGGLLTLLSFVLILAPANVGGLPDVSLRVWNSAKQVASARLRATASEILAIYMGITVAIFVSLLASNVPGFDALCLALSSISTGGFMPREGTLDVYQAPMAKVILAVAMLIGATSIVWHRQLAQLQWSALRRHRESYAVLLIAILVGCAYGVAYSLASGNTVGAQVANLGEGLFTGISLITTSGFEVRTRSFAVLPIEFVMIAALIGAGIFSTAGGLKYYRVGAMIVHAHGELHRLLYPHGVRAPRFGSHAKERRFMTAIWSYFILSLIIVNIFSVIVAAHLSDFSSALTVVVAAFANMGALYSVAAQEVPQWPAFADMAAPTRLVLAITMLLGRLEILVFLGALVGGVRLQR